jgi:plastocyanin
MRIPGKRRGRWAFALLTAVAAVAVAGPSGGQAAGAAAQASGAKTVAIENFAFHPQTLKIKRGGRVAFANSSEVAHTATRGGSFDTRRIAPGKSALVRFNQKGTFAYHCKIHPFMKGRIVVE